MIGVKTIATIGVVIFLTMSIVLAFQTAALRRKTHELKEETKKIDEETKKICAEIERICNETKIAILLKVISTSEDSWERCNAAEKLGELRDDTSVSGLITMLQSDPDHTARCFAAMALGRFRGNEAATKALEDALKTEKNQTVLNTIPTCIRNTLKRDEP